MLALRSEKERCIEAVDAHCHIVFENLHESRCQVANMTIVEVVDRKHIWKNTNSVAENPKRYEG